MSENERDEIEARYFSSGWDAAIDEVILQFSGGRIIDFLVEQKRGRDARS